MYSCPSLATKTRRPLLNCVLSTRSYHSADCNTDRSSVGSLVGSKVRLQLISTHRSKQKGRLQPAYSSTQLGQQSQTCASTSPTPFKSPSATAPHQVLKKMTPHPCRHLQLGHGHLWQEREVDPRLVWGCHCRTRASDSSQAGSTAQLPEGAFCIQEIQQRCPTDRSLPRQGPLAESLSEHPTICWLGEYPHHVRSLEDSFPPKYHAYLTFKVSCRRYHPRPGQTDEEMGRTLPTALL